MNGHIIAIIIGSIIGGSFSFFYIRKRTIERMKPVEQFIGVLIRDYKARILKDIYSGKLREIETDIAVIIRDCYPKLPSFNKKIFNYPVKELVKRVDWTINPMEFLVLEEEGEKTPSSEDSILRENSHQ